MITNHVIKNNHIFLYFDYSYEIGSFNDQNKKSILNTIYDYLKNTKIEFNGKKLMLMIGSTLIASLIYVDGIFKLDSLESNENVNSQIVEKVDFVVEEDIVNEDILEPEVETTQSIDQQDNQNFQEKTETEEVKKTEDTKSEIVQELEPAAKEETKIEDKQENLVTVYRSNGTVLQIEMEEYIVGVVAAEMPASFNIEALKAQSVLSRTYALKKISRGEILTDSVSTQSYIDQAQMKEKWGNDYSKYFNKIVNAVSATKGEYLTYNGDFIEAVYHSTSNGYTESSENVWGQDYPYLKSVESAWDLSASSYLKISTKELSTLMDLLGLSNMEDIEISIISRNNSGRVSEVKVADKIYTGVELRNLLGLRSSDFDIEINGGIVTIITRGYGHGVGMSQYGANGMAKEGYLYQDIIEHYYSGVKLNT